MPKVISLRVALTALLVCARVGAFQVPNQELYAFANFPKQVDPVFVDDGSTQKGFRWSSSTSLQSKKVSDDEIDTSGDSSPMWLFTLVLPLQLIYISNQWSRSSLYYLVDFSDNADPFKAMNVAVGFTESQYGILASLAFTTLFAVASLGAGIASDRYNRKVLAVASALGWGVATLGTSLSSSYTEVLSWRIFMGLACAFTTPTAYTLINDRVPENRKSFATSLYGTGVAFGGALASLSILLDDKVGWQQTTMLIGTVAFASACLNAVVLPNDPKGDHKSSVSTHDEKRGETSFVSDVLEVVSTTRAKWIFSGTFFRFCSGLCIGVWSAPYYKMTFPDNASEYAVAQALITAVAGSTSGLLGGAIADRLSANAAEQSDVIGQKLWIPVAGSVLAAPMFFMAVHADTFQSAMIWLSIEYLVAECWFGPTISAMLGTVGSRIGGTGQGLFTMTGAVANLAPTALGLCYGQADREQTSPELAQLLTTAVCLGYITSALCFAMSAQSMETPEEKGI